MWLLESCISVEELHDNIDSRILIINPFFSLPTQIGETDEKVHWLSVVDTERYQAFTLWVILQHNSFCCHSDCWLLISLHLFLKNASMNSAPLLSAHSMDHQLIFSRNSFFGKSCQNLETIQADNMIFARKLVKHEKDSGF